MVRTNMRNRYLPKNFSSVTLINNGRRASIRTSRYLLFSMSVCVVGEGVMQSILDVIRSVGTCQKRIQIQFDLEPTIPNECLDFSWIIGMKNEAAPIPLWRLES